MAGHGQHQSGAPASPQRLKSGQLAIVFLRSNLVSLSLSLVFGLIGLVGRKPVPRCQPSSIKSQAREIHTHGTEGRTADRGAARQGYWGC